MAKDEVYERAATKAGWGPSKLAREKKEHLAKKIVVDYSKTNRGKKEAAFFAKAIKKFNES